MSTEEKLESTTKSAEAPTVQDGEVDKKEVQRQADVLIAEGKKATALQNWEEGVAKYADALEIMSQLVDQLDPAMAPILLKYGKALYELAYSQQGVMGEKGVEKQAGADAEEEDDEEPVASSSNFVFSSADDVSDHGDEAAGEASAPAPEQGGEAGQGNEVDEPEDDYNAAWEVLDLARKIYSNMVEGLSPEEGREARLSLAESYLALGDVSLETENFPQAVQDYTSSLEIRKALLPGSSRALAYVHYQLGNVLELTPGRRDDALSHVEQALAGFKARLAELTAVASGASASNGGADVKGKGKATGISEEVAKLNDKEREGEKKDVEELIGDLEMKIEELKTAPPASDLISDSINHLLGQGQGQAAFGGSESTSAFGSASESVPVNDLTGMVKKKKKVVPAATEPAQADGAEKRKGEDGEDAASKKARTA